MKPLRFALLLFLTYAASSFAQIPLPTPPAVNAVTKVSDVEFGQGGGRALLAELAYPSSPMPKPMPAVLWIHGGGWAQGSQKPNEAAPLAAHGYFTASIEYRLSKEAQWPAQLVDCRMAVRWLRANAAKYNIDPDKIAVMGRSAGGHLAACLGTMSAMKQFDNDAYPGFSSKVQAVVDFCGPSDFTAGPNGTDTPSWNPSQATKLGLDALFGGNFVEKPDLWLEGSPIYSVKPDAPPFLLIHGDADQTVPYEQSVKLFNTLQTAGVPVQMITIQGGTHNLKAAKDAPPATPDLEAINAAVLAFLDKHLK